MPNVAAEQQLERHKKEQALNELAREETEDPGELDRSELRELLGLPVWN